MIMKLGVYLRRHHLGLLALFVALGGTSYAAVSLPKNSIGTAQIRTNGVGSSEIKSNSITSPKVKDGSLLAKDFKAGQLPAGANGAKGDKGDKGDQGIQGPVGVVGAITVQRVDAELLDNTSRGVEATCPTGTKVIGGGASVAASGATDIRLTVSRPFNTVGTDPPESGEGFNGWRVVYVNENAGATAATTIRAFAICAQV
jgi:hypothetical protein